MGLADGGAIVKEQGAVTGSSHAIISSDKGTETQTGTDQQEKVDQVALSQPEGAAESPVDGAEKDKKKKKKKKKKKASPTGPISFEQPGRLLGNWKGGKLPVGDETPVHQQFTGAYPVGEIMEYTDL